MRLCLYIVPSGGFPFSRGAQISITFPDMNNHISRKISHVNQSHDGLKQMRYFSYVRSGDIRL